MNTKVTIAGVEWNNPVTVASGTFGSGAEFTDFVDLNRLGAVTTKGVANVPWTGNPTPRVAETYGGMMNAVGLQNPGIDVFCERDIPFLRKYDTKIIVNVCGRSTEDYCEVVERLANEDVDMLEINISCPNVKEGGIAFGQNPNAAEEITKAVKKYAKQPIIMKLSPNVTSISEMAKAVEAGYAIAYAADARVIHSHNYTNVQQFQRNFDLGVSQAEHPEVFAAYPSESEGKRMVKDVTVYLRKNHMSGKLLHFYIQCACKYAGYLLGKNYRRLPGKWVLAFTSNKEYWKQNRKDV